MEAPYNSTLKWIKSLNLTLDDAWRQWIVDNKFAGFTQRYRQNGTYYGLSYESSLEYVRETFGLK
ncbi:hypothetical protein ACJIZ3_011397 [Penstemon smallii]|uniref:Uncharacterized protein n=1 Tax=Penstemon smallii TaxID=265156 RepID=A0ABD3UJF0_9LAMI